MKERENFTRKV